MMVSKERNGMHPPKRVVDIGINITNPKLKKNWRSVVQRAIDRGVDRILLTGTSMKKSRESLELAEQWYKETGCPNLYVTVGVHPHDAKTFNRETIEEMKELLSHPLAVAVGECGLDYNRNFSAKQQQLYAFREQLKLACELDMPLFLHEREAHDDLIKVLDNITMVSTCLPSIVVHCFTGNIDEAAEYVRRGFYIGFTGTICMKDRGAPLRALLPTIPKDKIMVETDAPWMGFKNNGKYSRKHSEPSDCADVARKLGETLGVQFEEICDITTINAMNFFRLPGAQAQKNVASDDVGKMSRDLVEKGKKALKQESFQLESTKEEDHLVPGKAVVGKTPTKQQTKSKSALRRAKAKQKKEDERKALEGKVLAEQKAANATNGSVDLAKRVKKVRKLLRQINELKQKDPSALDEDQQKKIGTETSLLEELSRYEMQGFFKP